MLTFSKVKQLAWPVSLDALQDYKDIKLIAPFSDWSWQHSCIDRRYAILLLSICVKKFSMDLCTAFALTSKELFEP